MPAKKKSVVPKELTPLALEMIAGRFRALSEPVRLRLLNLLMGGEMTVGALVEATGSSQANVSKHLAVLREAGMIAIRKEGTASVCGIADPVVHELCELMCSRLREEMAGRARAFDPGI
jgi:ArsR family transcriptional regulator